MAAESRTPGSSLRNKLKQENRASKYTIKNLSMITIVQLLSFIYYELT